MGPNPLPVGKVEIDVFDNSDTAGSAIDKRHGISPPLDGVDGRLIKNGDTP